MVHSAPSWIMYCARCGSWFLGGGGGGARRRWTGGGLGGAGRRNSCWVLDDRKIDYWRTGLKESLADLKRVSSWIRNPSWEALCCLPSAHSNPKGGGHVNQVSLTNQGLQIGPAIEIEACSSLCLVPPLSVPLRCKQAESLVWCVLISAARGLRALPAIYNVATWWACDHCP